MNKLCIFVALGLAALISCTSGAPAAEQNDNRIVNGLPVSPHSYRFVVALERRASPDSPWIFGGGGTILWDNCILTSASALHGVTTPSNLKVIAGLHDRTNPEGGIVQLADVVAILIHPDYNETTRANDLALLTLRYKLGFGSYVDAARLPGQGDNPLAGNPLVVTGWGNTSPDGDPANILQSADLQVVDDVACQAAYVNENIIITETTMLCAANTRGDAGACIGDEGMPLFSPGPPPTYIRGIVSWGGPCQGDFTKPGVYTQIGGFVNWINQHRP